MTPGKTDLWLLVALTAVAAVPRLWGLSAVGLTHFDEGGYAVSALAVARGTVPDDLYPLQHFLSPPLFFGLAGALMAVSGSVSDQVPLLASAVLGTLTVPLVFALGRSWNGRAAGVAGALLLALSPYHIAYSRVGLTDAAFLLFFLLALFLYTVAEARRSRGIAALAGLAVGLAWNTKYHGWLAAAIALAALLAWRWRGERAALAAALRRWAVSVAVACLLYVPWAVWVSTRPGGYARLAAEHGQFLREAGRWLEHAVRHGRVQLLFEDWTGVVAAALAVALVLAWWLSTRRARALAALCWAPAALLWVLAAGWTAAAALAALPGIAVARRRASHGAWVQLVALAVLTVLTPLYVPYSRLLLPWVAVVFALAGAGIADLAAARAGRAPRVAGLVAATLAVAWWALDAPVPPRRTIGAVAGFRDASRELWDALPDGAPTYVIGEPAVVFYLRAAGREARHVDRPEQAFEGQRPGAILALVRGRYGRLTGQLDAWLRDHPEAARAVGTVAARVGEVRLLDDRRRGGSEQALVPDGYDLEVFAVTVPP